ncbi:MAG: GFA family protein [Solirubrobacteraceae bacterium]|nr:GFA family protein [Solirubrobacteraceae bacterium]
MTTHALPVEGSCLCGEVRFRVTGRFITAGYCHCTHCQKRTGTGASIQGRVERTDLELQAGAELLKAFVPPAGGRPKVFCTGCGSHLFSGDLSADAEVAIRLGAFDGPIDVTPAFHMFVRSAPAWAPVPDDGLVRYDTAPAA